MENLLWIFVSALLVNNFVLAYFLGLCPFLGVSNSLETSARLGLATTFVMLVTAVCAWVLNTYVLVHAPYLRLICFIVVIASTVQFIEMLIKKLSPALFRAMGIFLPLITTNCAVFGACVLNIDKEFGFFQSLVASFSYAVGFGLALILFAGVRERILLARVPGPLQDPSIALVTAGMPFLLLVGAAPNAIAYDSKQFTTAEFFLYGIPASVILMIVVGFAVYLLWPLMGMPVTVPR